MMCLTIFNNNLSKEISRLLFIAILHPSSTYFDLLRSKKQTGNNIRKSICVVTPWRLGYLFVHRRVVRENVSIWKRRQYFHNKEIPTIRWTVVCSLLVSRTRRLCRFTRRIIYTNNTRGFIFLGQTCPVLETSSRTLCVIG